MRLSFSSILMISGISLVAACASAADPSAADESHATAAEDREVARVGGERHFAAGSDGAYFVYDGGVFRVDAGGKQTRLSDAPKNADLITVTPRFVVVTGEDSAATMTFYDRETFAPSVVTLADFPAEMIAGVGDSVIATLVNGDLSAISADGKQQVLLSEPADGGGDPSFTKLVLGKSQKTIYYAPFYGEDHALLAHQEIAELDLATHAHRTVYTMPGDGFGQAYTYVYDESTDALLVDRLGGAPSGGDILDLVDGKGTVTATTTTEVLTTGYASPVVSESAFYLAAKPGSPSGPASWKLYALDKKTLAMTDRGRVAPQVNEMHFVGADLFYAHSGGLKEPLVVRTP